MSDYQPLDLSQHLNAGLDILGPDAAADLGSRRFRGLPFEIADDPVRCFIALDDGCDRITVAVNQQAYGVIFAHRLLNSHIDDGGPVGIEVADYEFEMSDGQRIVAPVRERFEIATVPVRAFGGASGFPFDAVPDGKHRLMPKSAGPWHLAGARQTEYTQAAAHSYFLGVGPTLFQAWRSGQFGSHRRDRRF